MIQRKSGIPLARILDNPASYHGKYYAGIATATEAAVISVVWSAFLTVIVYREMSVKSLQGNNRWCRAGQIIGMMASSAAFGYALTVEKVPALDGKLLYSM